MSSTGQTALTIVGAGVGFLASGGNPMGALYGAQIGYSLGMTTLSTTLPDQQGPRVNDLNQQASTYGWNIPKSWGTVGHNGALIWTSGLIEEATTETQDSGGKGAPSTSQSYTTYSYRASFAVAFHDGPISAVRRIWANEHLIYENGEASDYGSLSDAETTSWMITRATGLQENDGGIRIYRGTSDQEPDPTIQSYEGVSDTPAFRDTAYLVFNDLQLERFGNRHPQIRVEYIRVQADINASSSLVVDYDLEETGLGVTNSSYFTPYLVCVDQDLTAHYVAKKAGPLDLLNQRMLYYKVFPNGVASFQYSPSNQIIAPGVGLVLADFIPGMDCEIPMFIQTHSVSSGTQWIFMLNGSLLGGGVRFQVGEWYGYMNNSSTCPFTHVGDNQRFKIGGFDGTDTYRVVSYEQYIAEGILGPEVRLRVKQITEFELTVAPGSSLKDCTMTEDYVYGLDMNGTLTRYSHSGDTLNIWDLSSEISLFTSSGEGLRHNRQDENVLVVREELQAIYLIDVTDPDNVVVTTYSGDFGSNLLTFQGFAYWNGMFSVMGVDTGVIHHQIYSLGDLNKTGESLNNIVDDLLDEAGLSESDYNTAAIAGTTVNGFTKSAISAPGASISQLMKAYQFSCYEDNNQLVFTPRGGSVDKVIPASDLGAGIDRSSDELLSFERLDDQSLPLIVNVSYRDSAFEYDQSSQSFQRSNIYDTEQTLNVELPLVLTGTEARQIAEKLSQSLWSARDFYKRIALPLEYIDIVPTDVIQTTLNGVTHTIRVTSVNVGEHIELTGIAEQSADYTSTIDGETVSAGYRGGAYPGITEFYVLDLPPLRGTDTDDGMYLAAHGYLPVWSGCVMYYQDGGGTWSQLASVTSSVTAGVVTTPAGDGEYLVMDNVNTITIRLRNGTISSATKEQLLADRTRNAACILESAEGPEVTHTGPIRAEIFQFQTVTENSDGTFTLSGLIRGQQGTEYAMDEMAEGDYFILLEPSKIVRASRPEDSLGYIKSHVVSLGLPFESGVKDYAFTYGISTRPFAPCHIDYVDNEDGTFTISWIKRPRAYGEWVDSIDVPDTETSDNFLIRWGHNDVVLYTQEVSGATSATITAKAGMQIQVAQVGALYGTGLYFPDVPGDSEVELISGAANDLKYGLVLEGTVLNDWAENLTVYYSFDTDDYFESAASSSKFYQNLAERTVIDGEELPWYDGVDIRIGRVNDHGPTSVTGYINQGVSFSGNPSGTGTAAEYVEIATSLSLDDFSVSLWFKPDGVKENCVILGSTNYVLGFTDISGGGAYLFVNGDQAMVNFTLPSIGWHNIIFTREGTTFKVWMDGEYRGSDDIGSSSGVTFDYVGVRTTGSQPNHTTWSYDELKIWDDKILNQTEINRLAGSAFVLPEDSSDPVESVTDTSHSNLEWLFKFDDADIVDETGSGGDKYYVNHATDTDTDTAGIITSHEPTSITGQIAEAADFSGNNTATSSAPVVDWVDVDGTYAFVTGAISFWFQPDGVKEVCFISGFNNSEFIRFQGTPGGVEFWRDSSLGICEFTLPTSGWNHIVINRDGTDAEVYLNGSLVATETLSSAIAIDLEWIAGFSLNSGSHSTWAYDQFRLFNRTLTAGEADQLYNES